MEFAASFLVIALIVLKDYSRNKDVADAQEKDFHWRKDWWKYRNDNMLIVLVAGLLGGLLSSEVGLLFLDQYLKSQGMSTAVIESADYTAVVASTWGLIKLFGKKEK